MMWVFWWWIIVLVVYLLGVAYAAARRRHPEHDIWDYGIVPAFFVGLWVVSVFFETGNCFLDANACTLLAPLKWLYFGTLLSFASGLDIGVVAERDWAIKRAVETVKKVGKGREAEVDKS